MDSNPADPKVLLLKPEHVQNYLKFSRNHLEAPEADWEKVM